MADLAALYLAGMSIPDLARLLGEPYSRVRKALLALGVTLRSPSAGTKLAGGKVSAALRGRARVFSQEWKDNIRAARLAHGARHAKGTTLKPSGYVEYTRGPDKGRAVHRVAMERRIGRRLLRSEVVHHRDENRSNNADDNLELMTRSAHTSLHRRLANGSKR